MKTNRYEVIYLLCISVLALIGLTCNGDDESVECPTGGSPAWTVDCDEFRAWSDQVLKNGEPHTASGCHPLVAGDTLTTDADGEAQLSLTDCPEGQIYLFRDSSLEFRIENCTEAQYETSGYCNPMGTWYVAGCADEFRPIYTGSALIEKRGSTFTVTYVDEPAETTLVVVLEGSVTVTPVLSLGPTELAPGAEVPAGGFYFTAPGPDPAYLGDLEPRVAHPVSRLGPVVLDLGVETWMKDIHSKATDDEVLPFTWPEDLGGPVLPENSFIVTLDGNPLQDPDAQDGLLLAVDSLAALDASGGSTGDIVLARLPDNWSFAIQDWTQDTGLALELLEEAGYDRGLPLALLYPALDEALAGTAELIAVYLGEIGVESELIYFKEGELDDMFRSYVKNGWPLLVLTR